MQAADEEQIEQSIDNLDMLLANLKAGPLAKDQALKKLGGKYGI